MSKPAFVVEVSKGGSKKLAMHCVFPASDEYPAASEHEPGEPYGQSTSAWNAALICLCFFNFLLLRRGMLMLVIWHWQILCPWCQYSKAQPLGWKLVSILLDWSRSLGWLWSTTVKCFLVSPKGNVTKALSGLSQSTEWIDPERIKFWLTVLTYCCLHGSSPSYLAETIRPVSRWPMRHHLWSANIWTLLVPINGL